MMQTQSGIIKYFYLYYKLRVVSTLVIVHTYSYYLRDFYYFQDLQIGT